MKGTIEYLDIHFDVTYDHDIYQDKHEISLISIYVSGSSVDLWEVFDVGGMTSRIEEKIYEQLHTY